MKNSNKINRFGWFDIFNYLWMIVFAVFCLIPVIIMISTSLMSDSDIQLYGYKLFPTNIDFTAYAILFNSLTQLLRAYGVSIYVTGVGTVLNVLLSAMLAYPLAKKDFKFKKPVTILLLITMLFSPGIVPTYLIITQWLNWKNTFAVMIIPQIGTTFNIIMFRTFFSDIPNELVESARIDGCSVYREFISIVVPISKTVFATCAVLCALAYWNDWGTPYLYVSDQSKWNVQMLLQDLVQQIEAWKKSYGMVGNVASSDAVVMATCVIGTFPVLGIFLYLQKYIVSGITVGAVKG